MSIVKPLECESDTEAPDQRAMVAAALERAAQIAHVEQVYQSHITARRIRALIDADHSAALDALVQERAGALIAEAEARGYRRGQGVERQTCARILELYADRHPDDGDLLRSQKDGLYQLAKTIRARGGNND